MTPHQIAPAQESWPLGDRTSPLSRGRLFEPGRSPRGHSAAGMRAARPAAYRMTAGPMQAAAVGETAAQAA